jgi:SAM-dependent methyltransferase
MRLLTEKELAWSSVVANNNMNRSRNASGVNSYEKDIKLNPIKFLLKQIEAHGSAVWLDLCCGEGRALVETAKYLQHHNLQDKARLTGLDLVDYFITIPSSVNCLDFLCLSVSDWEPFAKYDLITCVHGLHYAGDKLAALKKCLKAISDSGCFVANFDIKSININGMDAHKFIKAIFVANNIQYSARTRVIQCEGPRDMDFGVRFLGADDMAGPNYTGQEAVNAYYAALDRH